MGARIVAASEGMAEAAERIRAGKLVAFPTETVYGLGANALDAEAVARIFAAKGRPSTNPLIVHTASAEEAGDLTHDWPITAEYLEHFWPGPLTLVMEKNDRIPDIVTAGGTTVGVRVPNHPVALELLRQSGLPIAAPSANRSEEISPTTAQHVADSLGPWVEDLLILDGGPCSVGLESTVLDLTANPPRILRPGMISAQTLRNVVGMGDISEPGLSTATIARSPGQMPRHYAPHTPLMVVPHLSFNPVWQEGDGLLLFSDAQLTGFNAEMRARIYVLPRDPNGYASSLYATLHDMDTKGYRRILVEEPPAGLAWNAIHDRLRRAGTTKED